MLKIVKQARAALSLLNPEEVQSLAERPVSCGLVAAGGSGCAELGDFPTPAGVADHPRLALMERVHRAGAPRAPSQVDPVLYEHGIQCQPGSYTFDRDEP